MSYKLHQIKKDSFLTIFTFRLESYGNFFQIFWHYAPLNREIRLRLFVHIRDTKYGTRPVFYASFTSYNQETHGLASYS